MRTLLTTKGEAAHPDTPVDSDAESDFEDIFGDCDGDDEEFPDYDAVQERGADTRTPRRTGGEVGLSSKRLLIHHAPKSEE